MQNIHNTTFIKRFLNCHLKHQLCSYQLISSNISTNGFKKCWRCTRDKNAAWEQVVVVQVKYVTSIVCKVLTIDAICTFFLYLTACYSVTCQLFICSSTGIFSTRVISVALIFGCSPSHFTFFVSFARKVGHLLLKLFILLFCFLWIYSFFVYYLWSEAILLFMSLSTIPFHLFWRLLGRLT